MPKLFLDLTLISLSDPERARLNERMQERKEKARKVIEQDLDGFQMLQPTTERTNTFSTEPANKLYFGENSVEEVKVIDLASDEVSNADELKIKSMWSKNEPENPPNVQPTPFQSKVVFVKCKICLKKVRKDMIERHKRVRHAISRSLDEKVDVNVSQKIDSTNQLSVNTNQQSVSSNDLSSAEVKTDKQVKMELTNENERKEAENTKTDYCTLCRKQFKLRKYFMKHMSQIHRKIDPKRIKTEEFEFKCSESECSQSFTSKFYLSKHLFRKHGKHDLALYCKLCKQEFKEARYLKRHKKSVHTGEMHFFEKDTSDLEELFKCPECNEAFLTEKIAKYHQLRKHVATKGEKRNNTKPTVKSEILACKLCKHDFKMKKYLDRHKKSVHADELHLFEKEEVDQEETFPCTICSETFRTESSLKYHTTKKHGTNHTCDICSKVFKEDKYLRTHKEMSHGSKSSAQIDLDSRKCKVCETQFSEKSSAWNMRRHMLRMHAGTK